MLTEPIPMVPPDALNVALVLALSFFIGLEREERKQHEATYAFGGVRTFPLIGLVSYALAILSGPQLVPWLVGLAVIGGFMLLSYGHKLVGEPPAGLTTEISALATFTLGGLVQREHYWLAATIAVLSVLLLELKKGLEGLTRHVASNEIIIVAKFLVLLVVILPIVPDREVTRSLLNPFKVWLVVVAVSGVSFASYLLQRALKGRGGVALSAILGGIYSSTVTTVVLARQARTDTRPNLFAGSILMASGMMYVRLVIFLVFFNTALAALLCPAFATIGLVGVGVGWLISRKKVQDGPVQPPLEAKNPLELSASFLFAFVFVISLILTHLAREHLGRAGLYFLAALMGFSDVDPFILGLAQTGPTATPLLVAAPAIVIAAASNNVIKAIYAHSFADGSTGRKSLMLLLALAALGLVPLVWLL